MEIQGIPELAKSNWQQGRVVSDSSARFCFGKARGNQADQIVVMATDTDVRVGRTHPEAELVAAAGGSEGTRVKLHVTNVYSSSEFTTSALQVTDTVADLKKLLESAFASRPAPNQQRLIFRGKQCEETQQLGHILRGVRWRLFWYHMSYSIILLQTTDYYCVFHVPIPTCACTSIHTGTDEGGKRYLTERLLVLVLKSYIRYIVC